MQDPPSRPRKRARRSYPWMDASGATRRTNRRLLPLPRAFSSPDSTGAGCVTPRVNPYELGVPSPRGLSGENAFQLAEG